MRAVVQRVRRASVTVAAEVIGRIEQGLLILLGVHRTDTPEQGAGWPRKSPACVFSRTPMAR